MIERAVMAILIAVAGTGCAPRFMGQDNAEMQRQILIEKGQCESTGDCAAFNKHSEQWEKMKNER